MKDMKCNSNKFHLLPPSLTMKISSKIVSVSAMASLITLLLLFVSPHSEAAISCSDVLKDLRPCVNYLRSGSGKPPAACCSGASSLASAAGNSADKKTACGCIKTAAQKINPISQLAQSLAGNCGISLPVPVSPNVDCSKVT